MRALAIDSSTSNMIIAARNEDKTSTVSCDIGMKQSEKILPLIDFVLGEVGLSAKDLEFTALCSGPGTFTGLRLAYSALKALNLASGAPIYDVPTMEAIAFPFLESGKIIVPVVDAKKNQFFAAAFKNGKKVVDIVDNDGENFLGSIKKICEDESEILVVGTISKQFVEATGRNIPYFDSPILTTEAVFKLAAEKMEKGEKPLEDYDGPKYYRKSEAEINFKG